MSRNKMRMACAALLALVLLSGCSARKAQGEPELIVAAAQGGIVNQSTDVAKAGTLTRDFSTSANLIYPRRMIARLEVGDAQFVELRVSMGDVVKKGDPVAVFSRQTNNVRLLEISQERDRLDVQMNDMNADCDKRIAEFKKQISELDKDPRENNVLRAAVAALNLRMDMVEQERTHNRFRIERKKDQLSRERADIQAAESELVVTAPMDGVVHSVQYFQQGVTYYAGQNVADIYDPGCYGLFVPDGVIGALRLGQKVEVEYGKRDSRETAVGTVAFASNILDASLQRGGAVVYLDEPIPAVEITNPSVSADVVDLKNVLLLKKSAVYKIEGKNFVSIWDGQMLQKRYVAVGMQTPEAVWILDGLHKGQQVVIN